MSDACAGARNMCSHRKPRRCSASCLYGSSSAHGNHASIRPPFGVKVCALEPGGIRTNWGARANRDTPELRPDYEPSVGAVAKALKSYWGKEISDPAKVAQVVLRLASSDRLPAHLLIGSDAVRFAAEAEKTRAAEGAQWRDVSLSTDVASATALPAMRF